MWKYAEQIDFKVCSKDYLNGCNKHFSFLGNDHSSLLQGHNVSKLSFPVYASLDSLHG